MVKLKSVKVVSLVLIAFLLLSPAQTLAQGKSGQGKDKKAQKKLDKEARKLAEQADEAGAQLGQDKILCILAAHTANSFGNAQELKSKLTENNIPFGQFVSAVFMASEGRLNFDDTLKAFSEGKSLGQIAKERGLDMADLRKEFGQFRSEIARAMTNPPTNCP
jgi:hypothetical protein